MINDILMKQKARKALENYCTDCSIVFDKDNDTNAQLCVKINTYNSLK